jgi:tRNA(Ile2) C34 agmatinyltransferase TiaS
VTEPAEVTDPDHPSCPRCPRFIAGPNRGRIFFRCLPCAIRAAEIRNAQKEASHGA